MKYRLLDVLCCPECNNLFEFESFKRSKRKSVPIDHVRKCREWCHRHKQGAGEIALQTCMDCYREEVDEGMLTCARCSNNYPIIKGIPWILPPDLLVETLSAYHSEFLAKYGYLLKKIGGITPNQNKKMATLHLFSYQWTNFLDNFDYFKDIYLSFVRPFLNPDDFQDKLVQTAYSHVGHFPLLHIVQADAYAIPFHPCFDFVYSVGVLQHLPAPLLALKSIAMVVPNNHPLYLWVYGKREIWYKPVDLLRKVASRLSFKSLYGLSFILALVSEIFLLTPYRLFSNIEATKRLAEKIPGRIYTEFPFKENVLGWFDRLGAPVTFYFSKQDIVKMLEDSGFNQIRVAARPAASASWVATGKKIANGKSIWKV